MSMTSMRCSDFNLAFCSMFMECSWGVRRFGNDVFKILRRSFESAASMYVMFLFVDHHAISHFRIGMTTESHLYFGFQGFTLRR